MTERFIAAKKLVSESPVDAIPALQSLQQDVSRLGLLSKNESLQDVGTRSLPLVALEHQLAMAFLAVPTGLGQAVLRKRNVRTALDLLGVFLQNLENLELLKDANQKELHMLLETTEFDGDEDEDGNNGGQNRNNKFGRAPPRTRDDKIQAFREKQALEQDLQKLQSLQQRRGRLDVADEEEMDGYDGDGLERQLAIKMLSLYAAEALEEWHSILRELPMIEMQIDMERRNPPQIGAAGNDQAHRRPAPPLSAKPLQLTHITQDSVSGQLQVRKEEILSKVFRPGWNQPTMTLEELGDMERRQAIEREEQQKLAEAAQKDKPRRYEELVRDGMEDDLDKVDASAKVDRDWDDWKDENPRGSGNKMGDRGDRNF